MDAFFLCVCVCEKNLQSNLAKTRLFYHMCRIALRNHSGSLVLLNDTRDFVARLCNTVTPAEK